MTNKFTDNNLILHKRPERYDKLISVVSSSHANSRESEYQRWKFERWIRIKYFPVAFLHDPIFVILNLSRLARYFFKVFILKAFLGLEHARITYESFLAIREWERDFLYLILEQDDFNQIYFFCLRYTRSYLKCLL